MRVRHVSRKNVLIPAAVVFTAGILGPLFAGTLLMWPHRHPVRLPAGFARTEVSFASGSGAVLRGNLLKGTPGRGVVILMHGVRGHRGEMAGHAEFLHKAGYSVLLFDFQAHGESSGSRITSGYLESLDARAAVDFVRREFPGEKVGVLGVSLGGVAVVLAEPALKIDAAVLELVYADIERAVKNRMAIVLGDWARPLSWLLTCQLKPRIGVGPERFDCVARMPRLTCPKLFIAGANDRHARLADSKMLFAAGSEPKELWVVKGAQHQNIHAMVPGEYERRVLGFLEKKLN